MRHPLLPAAVCAALAAISLAASPTARGAGEVVPPEACFPLAKGTTWTYAATVATADAKNSAAAPTKLTFPFVIRITDSAAGEGWAAALLSGYPDDLPWSTTPPAGTPCILLRTGTNNYFRLTENVDALWARLKAGEIGALAESLTGENLILQAPLHVGMRFGDPTQTFRSSYCWNVTGQGPTPEIAGLPSDPAETYDLALRTSPDRILIRFTPGVGILSYNYHHNGTPADVELTLTEFQSPDQPEEAAETQAEMNARSRAAFETADAALNKVYAQLRGQLDEDGQNKLKVAQRAWLAYRDAQSDFLADLQARGGSLAPLIFSESRLDLTNRRTAELQESLSSGQ